MEAIIKVVIHGSLGRVGRVLTDGLCREPGIRVVGAVDLNASRDSQNLPDDAGTIPFSTSLGDIITECHPDVVVDFTLAQATMPAVRTATEQGVHLVIGTTGLSADDLREIDQLARDHNVGAVVAPNFALGAVLMVHLARIASKYLDFAEIIELHHNQKVDAPSGTALSTARAMAAARGEPFKRPPPEEGETPPSRGLTEENVSIHSVRLPGLMAHQEVLLGSAGQTLGIRHDTINRECYIPGVVVAIREVTQQQGLVYGLDRLLGLVEK